MSIRSQPIRMFGPFVVLLSIVGCALNTVRPPTPATRLELDRNEQAPPGEHYYLLIWSWQGFPKRPANCHTFATVVHTADSNSGQPTIVDLHTISWLPATLTIRPTALAPEPAVNLNLKECLDYARKNGERVLALGSLRMPSEILPTISRSKGVSRHQRHRLPVHR